MPPTELRRRMSRRSRTSVKLVGLVAETTSSLAWMFSAPTSNCPTFPVTRAPPTLGDHPALLEAALSTPRPVLALRFHPQGLDAKGPDSG